MNYLRRHWRGEHSFAWAFWFNLVALRVAVFVSQDLWIGDDGDRRGLPVLPVVIVLLVVHGVLFLWQAMGVVRAGERHALDHGTRARAMGTQLIIVALFLLTLADAIEGYQTTLAPPSAETFAEQMDREYAESYSLVMVEAERALHLEGLVAHGVTKQVREMLDLHTDVEKIVLSSNGGNIYEARGLARLFRARSLGTHVNSSCASACTIAFIGGSKRSLQKGARFGLHRYRMDADHEIIVTNPEREQERDRALFLEAGVAPDFVDRMYDAAADEMWWPTDEELLGAGVVHAVVLGRQP